MVKIRYLVDEHGVPLAVEVLDREVPSSLLAEALDAALAARFEPAMARGRPVPAERVEALRFELPR